MYANKILFNPIMLFWLLLIFHITPGRADCAAQVPITATNASNSVLSDHTLELLLSGTELSAFDWSKNAQDIKVTNTLFNANYDFWVESFDDVGQTLKLWIQIPDIPANDSVDAVFSYLCNDPVMSDISATFADQGFKFQSQPYNQPIDMINDRADGDAIFDNASVTSATGYGCTAVPRHQ